MREEQGRRELREEQGRREVREEQGRREVREEEMRQYERERGRGGIALFFIFLHYHVWYARCFHQVAFMFYSGCTLTMLITGQHLHFLLKAYRLSHSCRNGSICIIFCWSFTGHDG